MKQILLLTFTLVSLSNFAQVGINTTTPNPSSILDVSSTNKGMLAPRVSLSNINLSTLDGTNVAATGLLIWNTNAATTGGNGIGFYYYDGTIWVPLMQTIPSFTDTDDQATDVFSLTGNTLNLSLQNDGVATQTVNLSSLQDADWFEVGGTTPANAITDNIYTSGDVSIGKVTAANGKLDIANSSKANTLVITNNTASSGIKAGIDISITMSDIQGSSSAIKNTIFGLADFKIGTNTIFDNNNNGPNNIYEIASHNTFDSNGIVTAIGTTNLFAATADAGTLIGLQNLCWGFGISPFNGVYNDIIQDSPSIQIGLNNDFSNDGTGNRIGVLNTFTQDGSGDIFGIDTTISTTGSGDKYGERIVIENSSGGKHYGIYSDVTKSNSYAGYFLGRVALGTTTSNNYILPSSRGSVGEIMRTDGSGNVSWVNPLSITVSENDPEVNVTTTNRVPKWNGTTLIDGIMFDNGTNVGIATSPTAGNRLEVSGKTKTTNFQMTAGAGATYLLQCDAAGNATWVDPPSLAILANDWKQTGNAGTVAGTNFIGTTDAQNLEFRTNNIIKLRLTQQGQLGFVNSGGSVMIGINAGDNDDLTSNDNTFVGTISGQNTTTGDLNTALGYNSLNTNSDGIGNTAIGVNALITNASGTNNTGLGRGANVSTSNLTNATAIGFGSTVNASNKVRIGNAAVTLIEGQVAYTFPSDARFKFNIKENVPGLDFIKKLKPVTYNFDTKKFDAHINPNRKEAIDEIDFTSSSTIVHTGFLAQDIEKICTELGYNFDGLHIPDTSNPTDNYSVANSQFIMPLVKAMQEQQEIIETQKTELEQLKVELEKLKSLEERITVLEKIKNSAISF